MQNLNYYWPQFGIDFIGTDLGFSRVRILKREVFAVFFWFLELPKYNKNISIEKFLRSAGPDWMSENRTKGESLWLRGLRISEWPPPPPPPPLNPSLGFIFALRDTYFDYYETWTYVFASHLICWYWLAIFQRFDLLWTQRVPSIVLFWDIHF